MADTLVSSSSSVIVENWSQHSSVPSEPSGSLPSSNEDNVSLQAEVIVRLMAQMLQCEDADEAARVLANRLQQFLGCRQVAIGLCVPSRLQCRIRGLSGVVRFDSHSRFVAGIQDALDETLAHEAELAWPPGEAAQQEAIAHHRLVGILGAQCVASAPLRDQAKQVMGVVLLVDEPAHSAFTLLGRYGAGLAACLAALERQRANLVTRRWRQLRAKISSWRGRAICLAIALLGLAMMLPWPYHVSCECLVQPVVRRYVAAPYDGTLAATLVRPGDVVRAGEVLARMDPREIQWELDELQADYARASKERDAAMAARQTSTAQLAELEMERLDVQITQLEHRFENLAIRSPIDGVVVSGDLEKAEGAPLTIGQTLFEVAPLDRMSVEVNVPEEDIGSVQPEMQVVANLEAFPDDPIIGSLDRIHPQAELRDKESVFVAEFQLGNPQQRLRPGMNGSAQIRGPKRSLGWILFHKPWTSLRRALAW